jgi:hypothetical protein
MQLGFDDTGSVSPHMPSLGTRSRLEVDAHHDAAEGGMTDFGEPGGGEDAAAADVELP